MVKLFGFSFLEPEPVSFWKGVFDAFPKVCKPEPPKPKISGKVVAVAGGALAALALYKMRHRLRKWIPGLQRLKTAFGCEPPVILKAMGSMRTCFESVRSGSVEELLLPPKNQLLVGDVVAGEFQAVGCAVRMADWIVMPSHVFAACEAPCLKGRQHWIRMSKERDYLDLDTDLIAFKLTEKELSTIGVSCCSISHALPYTGDFVQIVGAAGKGTTGVLRHDRNVFGRVMYDGTTVSGYSGAAYTSGNRLVAIHTNGGAVNGGYSASYIYSLLCAHDRIKPEDSEDWLRNQFQKDKNRIRYDKRWNDLDEVRVEVGGRYAVVSRDAMARAFGVNWADEIDTWGEEKKASYVDECAGEASSSKSGVSSELDKTPDPIMQEIVFLMKGLTGKSQRHLKNVRSLLATAISSASQASVTDPVPQKSD